MKRLVSGIISVFLVSLLYSQVAFALSVGNPTGDQTNGWFKDKFTVNIRGNCQGLLGSGLLGALYNFNYTSTTNGSHNYAFYTDSGGGLGNVYLRIDNQSSFQKLNNDCTNTGARNFQTQFVAKIDSNPPSVGITSPNHDISTDSSSYEISGFAEDSEGNLSTLTVLVNGGVGPDVSFSNGKFHVTVPLENGQNQIQMIAYDIVNHNASSNVVNITTSFNNGDGGGGGGGGDGGGSNGGGGSGNNSGNSSSGGSKGSDSSKTKDDESTPAVKFGEQGTVDLANPYAGSISDPDSVQETGALRGATGVTYGALVLAILVLLGMCIFVIFKIRKSGLRRRIIVVVTLPSIIPILGLGFIGYQQLSDIVKTSLSGQLQTAAETSALKLQREFSLRNSIITQNSRAYFTLQNLYEDQLGNLSGKEAACKKIVNANVPSSNYDKVTSNGNCLPFLAGFAQLLRYSSASVNDYLDALKKGAKLAKDDIISQQTSRQNELMNSLRAYFPDLLEIDVVSVDNVASIGLARPDPEQPSTIDYHSELVKQATRTSLAMFETVSNNRQLLLTYPVATNDSSKTTLGGIIAAFDAGSDSFANSILEATPKSYTSDKGFIVTDAGDIIAPYSTGNKPLDKDQVIKLATTPRGSVIDLDVNGSTLTTRTAPVANTNWVVAVGASPNAVLAPFSGVQQTALLAIAGFLLMSLLLGVWFIGGIAGELEKIFQGALNFAKGKLDHRITVKSNDELQSLGDTMNKMADDIKAGQEALVQRDKDFINLATHELRAPITGIIGNLSMVLEDGMGKVDQEAGLLLGQAYKGTQRLRDIINDMLDIARLESGHAQFNLEPINIQGLTKSIVEMQTMVAQQAGINLIYDADGASPSVIADKSKLQIIITNFISNAIKYNRPNGSVTIKHKLDEDGFLVTSIADTGLGIPEDQKSKMFQKFFRVQNDDRSNVPGTGLGLHITKQFVEGMGGKVWFDSVHGQGTTFYFTVPLENSQLNIPKPATMNPNGGFGK